MTRSWPGTRGTSGGSRWSGCRPAQRGSHLSLWSSRARWRRRRRKGRLQRCRWWWSQRGGSSRGTSSWKPWSDDDDQMMMITLTFRSLYEHLAWTDFISDNRLRVRMWVLKDKSMLVCSGSKSFFNIADPDIKHSSESYAINKSI